MAGYLIYVPNCEHVDDAVLHDVGLENLISADDRPASVPLDEGPDGGAGALAWWPRAYERQAPINYSASEQTWKPCQPDPRRHLPPRRFWMGRHNEIPILPTDLQRRRRLVSREVQLADNYNWLVPRHKDLPKRIELYGGHLTLGDPVHVELYEAGQQIFDWFVPEDGEPSFPLVEAWEVVVKFLSANYRLNRDLVDFLRLLDQSSVEAACAAIIDFEQIVQQAARRAAFTNTGDPSRWPTMS